MDLKQTESYFRGYVFLPCCNEEHSYFHGYQPSYYPSQVSKCDAILQTRRGHQVSHTSRFTPHSGEYRLLLPATQRDARPQPNEICQHKLSVGNLPEKALSRDFREHRGLKTEAGYKRKRNRTIFTTDQLQRLENEFDRQQYVVGTQRFYLAADLGLNETQVKVWFQNRRIKWRKENLSHLGNSKSNCEAENLHL